MLFSWTFDLLSQIMKPLVNSSNDFSCLVFSFQRPSFLCTSSWLSSTLFSCLSSPLNSFELVLTQFHLSIFFSARSKWHSCKLSCLGQCNCLSIRSWFSTFDCVVILVSCAITIIQSYWTVDCYLWVRRSSHLNTPTWAWAEQLHAPRWIPDSQVTSMQVWSKHAT